MNPSRHSHGILFAGLLITSVTPSFAEVNKAEKIADGVYFHEGDIGRRGHCNNGWIVFDDYVLVIDGNFPSGAQEIIPKIKAITDKPIRFAFDTHHHGDHAYGNQIWVDQGAVPVAHAGVIEEMKKYETGYYGGKPGRWEDTAKNRPDVAASKLKPPTLLYNTDMIFDDGKHRVELLHFGVAHTHGDGFAWLPKEKILFTGDAAVNGAYNYVADGDVGQWIKTLEAAKKLGAKVVCPGHGPMGGPEVIEDQQNFFIAIRDEASRLLSAKKSGSDVRAAVDTIKEGLRKNERISRYIGGSFADQLEKAYVELGGQPFTSKQAALEEHGRHADQHGKSLAGKLAEAGAKPTGNGL